VAIRNNGGLQEEAIRNRIRDVEEQREGKLDAESKRLVSKISDFFEF
jgi:hypothetical protein